MENENEVVQPQVEQEPTPEPKVEEPVVKSDETAALAEKLNKEVEARRQLTERAKRAEAENKALKTQLNVSKQVLDVEDYIDISAALEGLDQREKSYLAEQHRLTGKPLKEIRDNEDFALWQSAYRTKVEKEQLALKPSGTQPDSEKPKSTAEKLATASLAEKEQILTEMGLYKSPRRVQDRSVIGGNNFAK